MPRAWSDREKGLIRDAMRSEGLKLFEKFGLRKTTVDEISKAARISKGAFYFFYQSKEELFFDIMESLESKYKGEIYGSIIPPGRFTREGFKNFFRKLIAILVEVPIFKGINPEDYEYLKRKIPEETLNRHIDRDFGEMETLFSSWMEQGFIRTIDIKALSGVLLSLFYLSMHREDIGAIDFSASEELIIDMLSGYLVIGE